MFCLPSIGVSACTKTLGLAPHRVIAAASLRVARPEDTGLQWLFGSLRPGSLPVTGASRHAASIPLNQHDSAASETPLRTLPGRVVAYPATALEASTPSTGAPGGVFSVPGAKSLVPEVLQP